MRRPARIAIAGAGAVVERLHLPAARRCSDVRIVALADRNLARAQALAARFDVPRAVADYRELADGVDGVLIALPNVLHAPAALEFLGAGIAVLMEKPLAVNATEAEEIVRAARERRTVLAAAMVSRHASGARWIKRAVSEGALGRLKRVELAYGDVFSWPAASSFLFEKGQAGGGVLIDLGPHMLDLLVWWLGEPALLEYRDDSMGGVEAECTIALSFGDSTEPVTGAISFSRLRRLANTARIVGEHRAVEWDIATDTIRVDGDALTFAPAPRRPLLELFAEQLRVFARAAVGAGEPAVSGEEAVTTVRLIERSYRERRSLERIWTTPALSI